MSLPPTNVLSVEDDKRLVNIAGVPSLQIPQNPFNLVTFSACGMSFSISPNFSLFKSPSKPDTIKCFLSKSADLITKSNKSLKNKLYRTDNSYIYHLVKDNNYHICENISYKKIDNFYKDHPVLIHYNSISSSPTSSPPVEKKYINYYNEYYHDF